MNKHEREVVKLAKRLVRNKDPFSELIDTTDPWEERLWVLPGDLRVIQYVNEAEEESWMLATGWMNDE